MPTVPGEPSFERVLAFDEALQEVITHAGNASHPRNVEDVPLLEAQRRVLARDVLADRDQPPFARSTRDGFALSTGSAPLDGHEFTIIGSVRAGQRWEGSALRIYEALEIMTGAPVPEGADAVLMVEHAEVRSDKLRAQPGRALRHGENVVTRGAEALAGEPVLRAGRRLSSAEIAAAASVGMSNLPVFRKPAVTIVSTGDELVELEVSPSDWQIRNSNSYALATLVSNAGGQPLPLPIAKDQVDALRERIAQGRDADLLLLTGGVSMGKYDLVEEVLREAGAEFIFTGALIQPGKPVVFGRLPRSNAPPMATAGADWTYFFGLPGNPVSVQVCFHLFVAPLLRTLAGEATIAPLFVEARLHESTRGGVRVTRFLPAELSGDWQGVFVRLINWQGSGDVAANARGNCYAVLPAGVESFEAGDTIRVLLR